MVVIFEVGSVVDCVGAYCDNIFRVRYLVVKLFYVAGYFVGDGVCDDYQVGLVGCCLKGAGFEVINIEL